jgi:hypothetical protein
MGTITEFSTARNRTLHLVDIENLIGDPVAMGPVVHETLDQYRALAGWRPGDHAIVAANPGLVRELVFEPVFASATRSVRGPDAADEYLLAGAPPEWVARRFGRIVIGSGDHIFAPRARTLRDLGVQVTIVSRSNSLSGALQGQGFAVRILTPVASNREQARAA